MIPHFEAFHFLMYQPFYHLTEALQQGTNVGLQSLPGSGNTLYDRLEHSSENKRIFYGWMKSLKQGSVPAEVVAVYAIVVTFWTSEAGLRTTPSIWSSTFQG